MQLCKGKIQEMNAAIMQMKHQLSLVGLIAGVIAITGLPPEGLHAEDEFVEQFKFSGGIVVAIDFDDGKFIADLATDGPFVIHALLRDEARVAAARQAIQESGVYGKVSCDLYNGRDLPYVDGLVNLVLCKEFVPGAGGGTDARAGSRRASRGGRSERLEEDARSLFPMGWTNGTSSCMALTTTESRWMMSVLRSDSAGTTRRNTDAPSRCLPPLPTWSLPMGCC